MIDAPCNPFRVERMPTLARLHRWGFRAGRPQTPPLVRGMSRLAFYAGKALLPWPATGTLSVDIDGQRRTAAWDARNRMFSLLYFDTYVQGIEPTVQAIIDLFTPNDGVLYDVGSNWGYHSFTLAARPGFSGRIEAFEPWPDSFRDMKRIVNDLGLQDRMTCHNFALGRQADTGAMTCGSNSGCAHISQGKGGRRVEIRALDELDLKPPDVIKIDTEGHEEQVMRGAAAVLARHQPMIVFEHRLSMLPDERQQRAPLELLESLGYQVFLPQWVEPGAGQGEPSAAAVGVLELIACDIEERLNNPGYCDLLACHRDKVDVLGQAGCMTSTAAEPRSR